MRGREAGHIDVLQSNFTSGSAVYDGIINQEAPTAPPYNVVADLGLAELEFGGYLVII